MLHRLVRECADEPHRKAGSPGNLVPFHALCKIPVAPLGIGDLLRAINARPEGDMVLRKHGGDLRCHPPEVRLHRKIGGEFRQFPGKERQCLPVKIRTRKERLTSVEREGDPVGTEILEP